MKKSKAMVSYNNLLARVMNLRVPHRFFHAIYAAHDKCEAQDEKGPVDRGLVDKYG
tara:strand:- start:193 stop:360 length:168 start_codon:yes stop_codon:yes gene_type:complete